MFSSRLSHQSCHLRNHKLNKSCEWRETECISIIASFCPYSLFPLPFLSCNSIYRYDHFIQLVQSSLIITNLSSFYSICGSRWLIPHPSFTFSLCCEFALNFAIDCSHLIITKTRVAYCLSIVIYQLIYSQRE